MEMETNKLKTLATGLIIIFAVSLTLVCIGVGTFSTATESGYKAAEEKLVELFAGYETGYSDSDMNTLRRYFVQQCMLLSGVVLFIGGEGILLCLVLSYPLLKNR